MTSIYESLNSLNHISRNVREHEVLRVVGTVICMSRPNVVKDVAGDALEGSIIEVLKWVYKRCAYRLPQEAWGYKSFELSLGGRNCSCVRLQLDKDDFWSIRVDDPDKNIAGRVWTTEVVLCSAEDEKQIRLSVRLLVSTPETDLSILPHVPGFIQQLVEKFTLMDGQQQLSAGPVFFETVADAENLIDYMLDPSRRLPIFMITLGKDGKTVIDVSSLSRAVIGIGYVAIVSDVVAWELTERFGKKKSVFGGGARIYYPGFSDEADPYIHRLILANQLDTEEDASRTEHWMRWLATRESILKTRLGREVLSFAMLRNVDLQLRQNNLQKADASVSEQLVAANKAVDALNNQVRSLQDEQDTYLNELEAALKRADTAESQAQSYTYLIQQLKSQLQEKGDDPDRDIRPPESWSEFADWCDEKLAGRLVLTSSARRGVQKPSFLDVKLAADCLLWLSSECRKQRINGGSGSINNVTIMDGIKNASCGSDAYTFDWNGRQLSADWHIKSGGNTRDPSRCLRIYYCFDDQTQQIIVSDMPAHRRTGAT